MTYGQVYKEKRVETFTDELQRLRGIHVWYKAQLEKARLTPTVPAQIASYEATVDAYSVMINALERLRQC